MEMFLLRMDGRYVGVHIGTDSGSCPGRLIHVVACKLCPDKNDWKEK